MPIFVIMFGIILITVGLNDKLGDLRDLIKEDFSPSDGSPSFIIWIVAIIGLVSIGYIKTLKPFANLFLGLLFVSLILSNRGLFEKFTQALKGS